MPSALEGLYCAFTAGLVVVSLRRLALQAAAPLEPWEERKNSATWRVEPWRAS
jgi:hypothetical protein